MPGALAPLREAVGGQVDHLPGGLGRLLPGRRRCLALGPRALHITLGTVAVGHPPQRVAGAVVMPTRAQLALEVEGRGTGLLLANGGVNSRHTLWWRERRILGTSHGGLRKIRGDYLTAGKQLGIVLTTWC